MTVLSKRKRELIHRMSEATKPKRELQAIQADYTSACQQAGDVQYKILCFQEHLTQLNQRINQLNQEANQLKEPNGKTDSSGETTTDTSPDFTTSSEARVPASISEHSGSAEHREDA